MNTKTDSTRTWEGDRTRVDEARAAYRDFPIDENLVRLAVELYSFRQYDNCRTELVQWRHELADYARRFIVDGDDIEPMMFDERANRAETLATHIRWIARQTFSSFYETCRLRDLAKNLYAVGEGQIEDPTHHTPHLLALGDVELDYEIAGKITVRHMNVIRRSARTAHLIADANQRTRVYGKLGTLYRKHGDWLTGYRWGIRACLVPGVPLNVRAKSLAALLGITR